MKLQKMLNMSWKRQRRTNIWLLHQLPQSCALLRECTKASASAEVKSSRSGFRSPDIRSRRSHGSRTRRSWSPVVGTSWRQQRLTRCLSWTRRRRSITASTRSPWRIPLGLMLPPSVSQSRVRLWHVPVQGFSETLYSHHKHSHFNW